MKIVYEVTKIKHVKWFGIFYAYFFYPLSLRELRSIKYNLLFTGHDHDYRLAS